MTDMSLTDAKGRPSVYSMTDRELLEEAVISYRDFSDAIEALFDNPMVKAMLPKGLLK